MKKPCLAVAKQMLSVLYELSTEKQPCLISYIFIPVSCLLAPEKIRTSFTPEAPATMDFLSLCLN